MQAEVLLMPDVTRLLEGAIDAAERHGKSDTTIAGAPAPSKSIGQPDPELVS